jgi:dihydrofolate reductase
MRHLGYYIILTADGMYADPEGGLVHYEPAEDEHRFANELVASAGDIVMARVMYTDAMVYWDTVDPDDSATSEVEREFARFWQARPKHIVSRGQPELGPNADLLEGDVVETVRQMKAADGQDIMLGCGAELFATLSEAGLIDTYRFLILPMAIGQGKALFGALKAPLQWRLIASRTFASGSVMLEYVRATPQA